MSADRYELGFSAFDEPMINGSRALGYDGAILVEVIRQQARDLDQLRTDLAAAVARAEQAEARLAAIDSAPTAASIGIDVLGKPRALYFPPPHRSAFAAKIDEVGGWTIKELIARPAKD